MLVLQIIARVVWTLNIDTIRNQEARYTDKDEYYRKNMTYSLIILANIIKETFSNYCDIIKLMHSPNYE